MGTELDIFKNRPLSKDSDIYKQLMDEAAQRMAGGGGTYRRISIKGGRFREIINGSQANVNSSGSMNVVLVDASPLSRFYYEGAYDPDKSAPPTCWSTDTQFPSGDVPEEQRQSARCMDCRMNVKGSGQGDSRACRFSQRYAIVLEGQYDKVYQMQFPATTLFGEAVNGNMPLQAYIKYLASNGAPPQAMVTQMYFDENSETPKLFFKAVRFLENDEIQQVLETKESEDVQRAITLTVSQTDKVQEEPPKPAPKAAPKPAPKKAAPPPPPEDDDDEDEVVEEPAKVDKKPAPATPAKAVSPDLSSIVDEWDD